MKSIIILASIFLISFGIPSQALDKEDRAERDQFGTRPMLSYLAKNATFLDEMRMKLLLTPEQLEKMKMIIKAEKDALDAIQQKWMYILKDEKLSVEEKREERDNMDKKIVEIAKKTKRDVREILTPFQYKEFIPWVRHKWAQEWTPVPKPIKRQQKLLPQKNPFAAALQQNKAVKKSQPTLTEAQKEARRRFIEALKAQSQNAQNLFSETTQQDEEKSQNPFITHTKSPGEGIGLEGFTQDRESLAERFKEALRRHTEKQE